MRVNHLFSMVVLGAAMGAVALAQGVPGVKLPASPAGQASVQVGGTWEKTADGQR